MQLALQTGRERLERVVELTGVRTRLDEADDGLAETLGPAECLVHVHAGVDVLPDLGEGIDDRLVRKTMAVVLEGVRGVDLRPQHRTKTTEKIDQLLLAELLDLRRLVEGGKHSSLLPGALQGGGIKGG